MLSRFKYILYSLFFLSGYFIGRVSHIINYYYTNHLMIPHHWITGVFILIVGLKIKNLYVVSFSCGLVLSDFNDMLSFKIFQPDLGVPHFWGFD